MKCGIFPSSKFRKFESVKGTSHLEEATMLGFKASQSLSLKNLLKSTQSTAYVS